MPQQTPPCPLQASAYIKQNKYQQAEVLYKEILRPQDLQGLLGKLCPPCHLPRGFSAMSPLMSSSVPPGGPGTGTAGDAKQQVRKGWAPGWRQSLGAGDQPVSPPQPLPRSSSFSKLRESIRRGSEKLVSRLRGEGLAGAAG